MAQLYLVESFDLCRRYVVFANSKKVALAKAFSVHELGDEYPKSQFRVVNITKSLKDHPENEGVFDIF